MAWDEKQAVEALKADLQGNSSATHLLGLILYSYDATREIDKKHRDALSTTIAELSQRVGRADQLASDVASLQRANEQLRTNVERLKADNDQLRKAMSPSQIAEHEDVPQVSDEEILDIPDVELKSPASDLEILNIEAMLAGVMPYRSKLAGVTPEVVAAIVTCAAAERSAEQTLEVLAATGMASIPVSEIGRVRNRFKTYSQQLKGIAGDQESQQAWLDAFMRKVAA